MLSGGGEREGAGASKVVIMKGDGGGKEFVCFYFIFWSA